MERIERTLFLVAIAVWLVIAGWLAIDLNAESAARLREQQAWRSTLASLAAEPVALVKLSDRDGKTLEVWRGVPGESGSTLVREYEPRDGEVYSELKPVLDEY